VSPRAVLVELVGPVMDDRGALRHTLGDFLAERGVMLRPGALDAVAGGTIGWSLETLLGGHGRDADPEALAALRLAWIASARRSLVEVPGAMALLRQLEATGAVIGLTASLPHEALPDDLRPWLVPGSDHDVEGAPRAGALRAWLTAQDLDPATTIAIAATPAMLLAATTARIGRVMRHGSASGMETLPWDGRIGSLAELLA
jgi:beta-phosphoglucomutase-like phosphatase (HAD superfamily)